MESKPAKKYPKVRPGSWWKHLGRSWFGVATLLPEGRVQLENIERFGVMYYSREEFHDKWTPFKLNRPKVELEPWVTEGSVLVASPQVFWGGTFIVEKVRTPWALVRHLGAPIEGLGSLRLEHSTAINGFYKPILDRYERPFLL